MIPYIFLELTYRAGDLDFDDYMKSQIDSTHEI